MPSTPQQLLDQATRHQAHLERLKTQDVNELIELLDEINANIIQRLQRNNITDFSRSRLESELETVRQLMTEQIDDEVIPTLNRQITELGQYESRFEVRSLQNVAEADYQLPADTQIRAAVFGEPLQARGPTNGKLLEPFIRDWKEGAANRVSQTIRAGFAQGQTTQDIVRSIRDTAMVPAKQNLKAVARTALQHAANEARQATWNANRDIVKKYRWVSTLDSRTTSQCQALDGQEYEFGEGPMPPAHINCLTGDTDILSRSRITNVYKRTYKGAVIKLTTQSGRTLTITPNHPVLTRRGWVSAGDINSGDKLACIAEPAILHNHKKDCVKAKFSDLFAAFDVTADSGSIGYRPTTTEDFHGDGADGNVRVVNINSLAGYGLRVFLANYFKNSSVILRTAVRLAFSGQGRLNSFFFGYGSVSGSFVRFRSQLSDLAGRRALHSCSLLLTSVAKMKAFFCKVFCNNRWASSESLCYSSNSNTSIEQGDDLRRVNVRNSDPVLARKIDSIPFGVSLKNIISYAGFKNGVFCAKSFFNKVKGASASFVSFLFLKLHPFGGKAHRAESLVQNRFANASDFGALLDGAAGAVHFDSVIECFRASFDGHVYNLENRENWYLSNGIITHNCRSTTVAVLDDDLQFLDGDGTRRDRDPETGQVGEVGAQTTYYGWLKRQPAKTQDSIIGPARGRLLRNGGLTTERFRKLQLDRNFEPATLEKMRELEPAAFERAGLDDSN